MLPTISTILDTRRIKAKSKKYPLKLRITYLRKSKLYPLGVELTREEYSKLSAPRINLDLQNVREQIREVEHYAKQIAGSLPQFSFDEVQKRLAEKSYIQLRQNMSAPATEFIELFEDPKLSAYKKRFPILEKQVSASGTLSHAYLGYIKQLLLEGRIGTAVNYQCSFRSLFKFKGDIRIADISAAYLKLYEQWAKEQEIANTTIGIYLRALRAIVNECISKGLMNQDFYPFGRRKYQIPSSRNIKKALSLSDIHKIFDYSPTCNNEEKARDFWMFCYLANGMNPKDVALLKFRNLDNGFIVLQRAKTQNTARKDTLPISVYISEEIEAIISRWSNVCNNPKNYIFPILEIGLSPLRQYELIQQFTQFINHWMVKICSALDINKKATTIVTRHSFSTIMKNSGASTEFIQEALGHTNKNTTENYLGSFDNELKIHLSKNLVAFKNKEVNS